MKEIFLNRVWATLAAGIDSSQVSAGLTAGQGARFGTIAANRRIRAVILDAALNVAEVIYITGITGDTLTIVRGADGTLGAAHLAGARIECRVGKSTMENFRQSVDIQDGADTLLGNVAGVDDITAEANPTLTAQAATGSQWKLPAAGANTGAAMTLNIDGQGAVSVVRPDGTAPLESDIPSAGYLCQIEKRAEDFVLLNPANLDAQKLAQVSAVVAANKPFLINQYFPTF